MENDMIWGEKEEKQTDEHHRNLNKVISRD